MRILLVEDDERIAEVLAAVLTEQNYVVDLAIDGQSGWELAETVPYDLVLLDVMLPKLDGISLCRRLRQAKNQVLVMLLTARDTTTDKLMGLDSGADDYVVKPFNPLELTARIRALLRRGSSAASPVLECGDLRLDPSTREVTCRGQVLQFSRKEYLLLELFLRNQHRVFSRSAIIDQLWSLGEDPPNEDTVKSHIKNIRRELKAVGAEDLIETLYGQGYRLNPAYLTEADNSERPIQTKQQFVDAAVAEVWKRTKGTSLERVAFLEQVIRSLKSGAPSSNLSQKAIQIAHNLAGSLGTFGFEEASKIARQIEMLFQSELACLHSTSSSRSRARVVRQLDSLVGTLSQTLQTMVRAEAKAQGRAVSPLSYSASPASPPILDKQSSLLIVSSHQEWTDVLAAEAEIWNIRTAIAPDLKSAQQEMSSHLPGAILLDLSLGQQMERELPQLLKLAEDSSPAPVLIFSATDQSADRVTAIRLGGQMFLPQDTPPAQVIRAVIGLLQESQENDVQILAVDDDPQALLLLKKLLEPEGIQIIGLEDSSQFWETLRAVQPDLLLLDLNMPQISGIELCQSIRHDFQWSWLPILFLSAQADAQMIQQAFVAGADDYITKPIIPEALSTRILNRLKRNRSLKNQVETDPLTGLVSQQQSIQALNQLLQLASRSQQSVCLAVLSLDYLESSNDQDISVQENKILQQFGQFLKQKFRAGDVLVRWDEEFVVGMYGIHRENGIERLATILEEWRATQSDTSELSSTESKLFSENALSISFSAGIAQYPRDGINLQMLYRLADAGLSQAKQAGGDRILPADWQPFSPADGKPRDILLIHPEDEFARAILSALRTRGYHTHWLKSGKEAVKHFKAESPDSRARVTVLSDRIADIDVCQFLQQLGTKRLKQTRMVLLLAEANEAEKVQALGASDYIPIPCGVPVVLQRLRQSLKA